MHMVAFLDRPAPSSALKMRATDVTDPRAPREVRLFEVPVERGDRELRLDDFVVTEAMGFARGASYQISIESEPTRVPPRRRPAKHEKQTFMPKG